jgi:hypothetical protein
MSGTSHIQCCCSQDISWFEDISWDVSAVGYYLGGFSGHCIQYTEVLTPGQPKKHFIATFRGGVEDGSPGYVSCWYGAPGAQYWEDASCGSWPQYRRFYTGWSYSYPFPYEIDGTLEVAGYHQNCEDSYVLTGGVHTQPHGHEYSWLEGNMITGTWDSGTIYSSECKTTFDDNGPSSTHQLEPMTYSYSWNAPRPGSTGAPSYWNGNFTVEQWFLYLAKGVRCLVPAVWDIEWTLQIAS